MSLETVELQIDDSFSAILDSWRKALGDLQQGVLGSPLAAPVSAAYGQFG
jgi:hypothetical protein